jgi:Ni,Fe-hydrogenase III large subunit/Ni,Fe-hydrogenase III component G
MSTLIELIGQHRRIERHRPWPRVLIDESGWRFVADQLAAGRLSLLGLWADTGAVHAALLDTDAKADAIAVVSIDCSNGRFVSLSQRHAPALRLERAIRDLFGFEPQGLPDTRPWLDHGRWGVRSPLGQAAEAASSGSHYPFLAAEGEGLHEIPVGPVHAGIIEPGHFRFSANGETIVRLEARLGYVHKGIERLMSGCELDRAAMLAGRCSGDSTIAYALAFARAAEAALGVPAPPRAHWLQALMAELERLANHLGDIGAICNDASFALMHAHCGVLRERVLRAAHACFGHRLMRDCVVPGGVSIDLDESGVLTIRALIEEIQARLPPLVVLYENTASLQDRTVGSGVLKRELAEQYAAGGYVGRASGRAFDARRVPGYPPYGELAFEIPVQNEGDVNARVWVRIREVEQSLSIAAQILERLPAGAVRSELPRRQGEGMALVEGFRGDVLVWLSLDGDGRVRRCHLRDPSWFQWPLLEAAIDGNIVADFPLCNKSFNCSYSGHDL